jgi:hypothetical protein
MNMPRRIVALSSVHHADLRVRSEPDPEHLRSLHMAALMQAEMVRASALYPIVFFEDPDADLFRPMALLGLLEGENAFVDPAGQWRASYIPAVVRGHPFSLVCVGTDDRHALCIDLDSPCVSRESGAALFGQDGQPTPALEEARAYFARLRQMQMATDAYTRALARLNLFSPFTLRAQRRGHTVELAGCFVVDASRLEGLSDRSLAGLRSAGWLAATYAHLASLHQIERLE